MSNRTVCICCHRATEPGMRFCTKHVIRGGCGRSRQDRLRRQEDKLLQDMIDRIERLENRKP